MARDARVQLANERWHALTASRVVLVSGSTLGLCVGVLVLCGDDVVVPPVARAQPLTAPTSSPREIRRSRATASRITGTIMIMISTDMNHHCGPRVAF